MPYGYNNPPAADPPPAIPVDVTPSAGLTDSDLEVGRRIAKAVGETTTHYFFNESWQVLETRVGDDPDPLDQYVWDIRYVDAPVVRFHDANTDGNYLDSGDNILYYCQDANWNVTALVSASGSVVERYMYAAYGKATVLEADWSADADNVSDVANVRLFQGEEFNAETGLYSSRFRTGYHPTLGVWTSRDPAHTIDGSNVYQYCLSNPAGGTDPMGLCFGTAPDPNAWTEEDFQAWLDWEQGASGGAGSQNGLLSPVKVMSVGSVLQRAENGPLPAYAAGTLFLPGAVAPAGAAASQGLVLTDANGGTITIGADGSVTSPSPLGSASANAGSGGGLTVTGGPAGTTTSDALGSEDRTQGKSFIVFYRGNQWSPYWMAFAIGKALVQDYYPIIADSPSDAVGKIRASCGSGYYVDDLQFLGHGATGGGVWVGQKEAITKEDFDAGNRGDPFYHYDAMAQLLSFAKVM